MLYDAAGVSIEGGTTFLYQFLKLILKVFKLTNSSGRMGLFSCASERPIEPIRSDKGI